MLPLRPLPYLVLYLFFNPFSSPAQDFQLLYDSAKKQESIALAKLSLESARKLGEHELIARAHFLIAYYQNREHDYYESLNNFFSALEHYRKAGNTGRQIATFHSIGNIYSRGGFFDRSIQFYEDGIELAINSHDKNRELSLEREIALRYRLMEEYEMAKIRYLDLIPKFRATGNENQISQCYLGLGYIASKQKEVYDTIHYYYTQAVNAFSTDGEHKLNAEIKRKYSLAYWYNQEGLYEKAKNLLLPTLEQVYENTLRPERIVEFYFNLGDTYQYLGITDSAILMYQKGMEYIEVKDFDFDYVHNAKLLYDFCRKRHAAESKACSQLIYEFTNEVAQFKEKLVDANARYQVAAADHRHQNELLYAQQQQDQRLINAMIFVALGLVILAGLIFYVYERKKRIQQWRKVLKELTVRPRFTDTNT